MTDHTTPATTAIYHRNGTEGAAELRACIKYARDQLGHDIDDTVLEPPYDETTASQLQDAGVAWAGDTEDSYPRGLEDLTRAARDEYYDHVVISHLNSISDSLRDVHDTITNLTRTTTVHVADKDVEIRATDHGKVALLNDAREMAEKRAHRQIDPLNPGEDWTGGRPPLGYCVQNGRLRPAANYDTVESTLHDVAAGRMSMQRAAGRLDCSRTTVRNAIRERPTRYGLNPDVKLPSHQ